MKHSAPATAEFNLEPPRAAAEIFGTALPLATAYVQWLATAGVERGLVGPRERDRLWVRHILNCTALEPWLPDRGTLLDLGSGAGLPGIVAALLRPEADTVLLEPLQRRASFLSEVVADLGLGRVVVVRDRAESFAVQRPESAAVVMARAVAPLRRLVGWAMPLVAPGGQLLALKGQAAAAELDEAALAMAPWPIVERGVHSVTVGGSVTQIVRLRRADPPGLGSEGGTSGGRKSIRRSR